MSKFIFAFLNFFLMFGLLPATARNQQDSSAVTISVDSSTIVNRDSVSDGEEAYDSLYQPERDTLLFMNARIRRVAGKQVARFKENHEYAYANDPDYWREEPLHEPGLFFRILNSPVTSWIFFGVIAVLILYGIYQLALENNFTMLIRKGRRTTEDTVPASIQDKINFSELIRLNQDEGNYRVATRFLYLRLIHRLRERGGISFGDSSTNTEIIQAIGNHPEAATFRWLATAYEYVYYGEFVPNQETYFLLKNKFDALQKSLTD